MFNSRKGQSSAIELVIIIPIIIIGILVLVLLVPNYQYSAGSEVNTFQLNAMAQSLLMYIVTNPGVPINWGLNASNLEAFGLAEPGQPYHLDPFKIMALVYWQLMNNNYSSQYPICYANQTATGFQQFLNQYGINALYNSLNWVLSPVNPTYWAINYTTVEQALGIYGKYNIVLVIEPLFRVKVIPLNITGEAAFLVNVTNYQLGTPVYNAKVLVSYIAVAASANSMNVYVGNLTGYTNASGIFQFTLPITPSQTNFYFIDAYASLGGLGDHGYYFNTTTTPLLSVIILPYLNSSNYNMLIFAHPHVLAGCLTTCNPGQTALGLRAVAVYKTIYGYTFESLSFTLNPGQGSVSYPSVACQTLTTSQTSNNYADCYWNLPQTPMLLIAIVTRNSQSTSCNTPITQILVIPYGLQSELLLSNRKIVFGIPIKNAPVGVASTTAYIGDSAYTVTLYLYYLGNVFGPMR